MPSTLVNGEWYDPAGRLPVLNPVDGTLVAEIGYGTADDAAAAVYAAAAAFESWAGSPARTRSDLLLRAAEAITVRSGELGTLLARETGKRRPEAVAEIGLSAEYFRWFAEEARRHAGTIHPHEAADSRHVSMRRPAGVVATVTPWNFPCSIQARKLAAALAAGCTTVARVSDKAPLAVTEMIRCVVSAGVPPGVLNLVHGPAGEVTNAFLEHPAVRVVSFTGSTGVGRQIMAKASERIVRPLLELGGDAPFIVFEDADLERAADAAMLAKFRNAGQSCIAANRFLVHDAVYDAFVEQLAARINAMTIGDGLADPVPDLSSCIDDQRAQEVTKLVDEAVGKGGRKVTRHVPVAGAFCEPALVVDAPHDCGLATTEVFGPAAGIFRITSEEEAITMANATEFGLAAYFFSTDASRYWRLAESLDFGIIGANNPLPTACFAPMGGTKQAGLGREGSSLGLEEFQETRYLAVGL